MSDELLTKAEAIGKGSAGKAARFRLYQNAVHQLWGVRSHHRHEALVSRNEGKMSNFSYGDVVEFCDEFAEPPALEKGAKGRAISSEIQGMLQVAWFPTKECPTIKRTWIFVDQVKKIHWNPCA